MILLSKIALIHSTQVLTSVPKHKKKAVICFIEVIHVLDQPHSKKSYSAISHNFNVNESRV